MIKIINEQVSESEYKEPIRVKFKVVSTNDKIKIDHEAIKYINYAIKSSRLYPEILTDNSDGSYQVVFPGKSDWLETIQNNVKSVSRSFSIELEGYSNLLKKYTNSVEESLKESYKLGDKVTWRNDNYIIIDDEDDLFVLRPVDRFQDSDFDDIDSGDPSEDVYLSKFQLTEDMSALHHYIDNDGYVSIENVANFVTDLYDGELDDRYSCIASIIHDYKDEGKVSTEVIDQYAGGHNLVDQ